ncbi:phosphate ABC transporter permease subunit PstC [Candidatus Endobugula sertula]|uniref:Phosphate transport system permease protein n=1 Tax=Candidatus Endobugula sertula TaxID=62101 RepID=A0A1D2QR05_9GAMM|nr:phosphate ABC transporter permease subunit PstC [Candidatus Endobugula sertula]
MNFSTLFTFILLGVAVVYYLCQYRSLSIAKQMGGLKHLHSLPVFYGMQAAIWCAIPCIIIFTLWTILDDSIIRQLTLQYLTEEQQRLPQGELILLLSSIENIAQGTSLQQDPQMLAIAERVNDFQRISQLALTVIVLCAVIILGSWRWMRVSAANNARNSVERTFMVSLFVCSMIAIITTIGIVFSVLFESIRFFQIIPIHEFVFGAQWSPQLSIREDQVGSSGAFGAVPLFTGTLLISAIAMLVAVPTGLMTAIYLSEYANAKLRGIVKPLLEILAGIPTVVYGFFAALTIAPMIKNSLHGFDLSLLGISLGVLDVSGESALAAGLVMGVMIIPFVSSLSDDVINAVPQSLRDGAYGLGSTQSETVKKVVFPAALPGIVGAILLAVSRAIGETMIVVMAVGTAAKLTFNPLESVTTVTVQMTTLLIGDHEFDSAKTLAAFALGLVLFILTLGLNFIALRIVKKYREQYD